MEKLMRPQYTKQFKKDVKVMIRRRKDFSDFKNVIGKLLIGKQLEPKYNDHPLTGFSAETRECHIEPDWLLIYQPKPALDTLVLVRTGTHADLFD
jgi:mRNA interferase YafQ